MRPILLGYGEAGRPVYLNAESFKTSMHVLGASRSGKSKMAELIARQLIDSGEGMVLIEPHGAMYEDILRWLAYMRPRREILLFNPSYDIRIVGFNPFHPSAGDIATNVDRIVRATIRCWSGINADSTPRLERRLKAVYHTVIECGYSLEVIPYLLSFETREVRRRLTAPIKDPLIIREWEELDSYTKARDFYDQIESVRNRIFRFLGNRQIRRTFGLPQNTIDLSEIIEQGKVLLVNLQPSPLLSEENGRLIGTLLLSELWHLGSQRRRIKSWQPPRDIFILIDEFWKYLSVDIPHMLSEGHKYGFHLMLFNQYLGQIADADRDAYGSVMTNCRIKVAFGGLSREDATTIADEMMVNQIDYQHEKLRLEHTAFRPVLDSFTVRTNSHGGGSSSGTQNGRNSSNSFDTYHDLDKSRFSMGESTSSFDGSNDSWSESESEVPITRHEEYTETSSVHFYTLEEELRQHADQIIDQAQREFTIRIPGKSTIRAITPFVKEYPLSDHAVARYVERCTTQFLSADDVDVRLKMIHDNLIGSPLGLQTRDSMPENIWEKEAS